MRRSLVALASQPSALQWVNPIKDKNIAIASEYLPRILTAQVYDVAIETPLTKASNLSNMLGNTIYLKREDTQPVFSFKIRGAYNKIANIPSDLRKSKGVVTCSAGNHAQGVALSANHLGINAIIVMPLATPSIKVNAVRRFGGPTVKILLHGQNYDEAAAEAKRLQLEKGLIMVHPFDDPDVIAGQGTIGMEIIKALNGKELEAVFVCVGGGGLLAGIAAAVKAIRPGVKVIGVEAADAAGMTAALVAGKVVTLPAAGLFADGAAVKTVGSETFRMSHALVDEMVTVETDEICAAIKLGFNDTRCVMEPAGALGIAGMVKYVQSNRCKDKTFVAITSGANMDFDRLRFVSERADSSEVLCSIQIPERPGTFREMHAVLSPRNITELCYRHNGTNKANVFVTYQTLAGIERELDKKNVRDELAIKGFIITDLSDNEMAKSHIRHLAGGRHVGSDTVGIRPSRSPILELIYRFEFPEAPGALAKFLHNLNHFNEGWSISIFHYRNHGHDFGRVLAALLVREDELPAFKTFLENLNYVHHDETNNEAYLQFLH